ncbi:hypothetical protein AKG95_06015 [Janthinobacterium lividum]|uniref:N-acetyltransferase domain-containing protein n=1 Tax=Janthinobacterium lividum TaxID=29581 RepID=A0A1S1UEA4_9BURK|nr:GNAT family N-acetyltransferase [Janthinobacterium lividum]OHV98747.1 hypothetical protein AKG95_06015 [Janthinobacterium lividum]
MAEFQACGAVSYYRDDMKALDDAYDAFVLAHARADDCFVSSLAIDEKYRGQGLFRQMFHEIRDLASRKGCARISLTVWEKSEALQVYLHRGFAAWARSTMPTACSMTGCIFSCMKAIKAAARVAAALR